MIPKDPVILLSYINMQLRNYYPSLEELCKSLDMDKDSLEEALSSLDYRYSKKQNRFL